MDVVTDMTSLCVTSMYKRLLELPAAGTETFFLWGPRQTGKSTLLRRCYPQALWIDLLKSEELIRYATRPELLRQELTADNIDPARQIVIDKIQKVPALLNEVHWLMENRGLHFALCGSSARKVRRGAANLLGGRALRYELRGWTAGELGDDCSLDQILNQGFLPRIYGASRAWTPILLTICDRKSQPQVWSGACGISPISWML